jgi:hypothetical protein
MMNPVFRHTQQMLRANLPWLLAFGIPAGAGAAESAIPALEKIRVTTGVARFETVSGRSFVPFGVNYFRPETGWAPKVWKQFNPEATRQDFARLKALGGNCVRVFLTFGSFCEEAGQLSPAGLEKFGQFLALAEEAGLYVHPTGPDHWEGLPAWARGDRYADETFLEALASFWKQFAARYRGRPVIFAYDLLNEPSVPWETSALRRKWNIWLEQKYKSSESWRAAWQTAGQTLRFGEVPVPSPAAAPEGQALLDYQLFRESVADEWTRRQVEAIKSVDPAALVTVGLIQWSVPAILPGVQHYSGFRPERQARFLDFMEIHFYPLARGAYEYRSAEEEQRNLAYLESVVREVARPGKPVVIAEFGWYGGAEKPTFDGGQHPLATEEQQAGWCRQVVETTAGLAAGWLNWGLYDHPQARDVSQLTGLLTADGQVKAWGRVFQNLSARLTSQPLPKAELGQRPALDWEASLQSLRASREFTEQYFRAFREKQ